MKRDNSIGEAKIAARRRIAQALDPRASVLEVFAGDGLLYDEVWHPFFGAAIDWDEDKARRAAQTRPRWAVYQGDSARLLACGFMRHVPFDVLDIDAWGSPWSFFHAWCAGDRARAPRTHVVVTDGYLGRIGIACADRTLFPEARSLGVLRLGLNVETYMGRVRERVGAWVRPFHGRVASIATKAVRKMALHYFVVEAE